MDVIEKITAQQAGQEYTDIWMVGEQLKEICRREPDSAALLERDLENEELSLKAAAGKIKAWADNEHKKRKGNCVCVPPMVAEGILREFYGLPAAPDQGAPEQKRSESQTILNLEDFL